MYSKGSGPKGPEETAIGRRPVWCFEAGRYLDIRVEAMTASNLCISERKLIREGLTELLRQRRQSDFRDKTYHESSLRQLVTVRQDLSTLTHRNSHTPQLLVVEVIRR
uniref:Uncharacterized protein n=1 Tax=Vespula pensylvanica TaxID=30213 RepID=A0A834P7N3_VESPE|nr:hypothetical protein H0235_004647 [Vespula pensylvanica]